MAGVDALLDVRDLRTALTQGQTDVDLLSGVSLRVRRGEIVGLVGESGVGKSLVLASVLDVLNPPARVISGEAVFEGLDVLKVSPAAMNQIRGREIAFIGPNPHTLLNPLLHVGKQVAKFVRAHEGLSARDARDRVIEMFRAVGIPDPERRLETYPHELSGGMAQRVVISVGLISSPKLILADEPTFGLDVTIQAQVLELIRELVTAKADRGMLLVTRDLSIIANYCQTVYVMDAGQIVESAPVEEFFEHQRTEYGAALVRAAELRKAVVRDVRVAPAADAKMVSG